MHQARLDHSFHAWCAVAYQTQLLRSRQRAANIVNVIQCAKLKAMSAGPKGELSIHPRDPSREALEQSRVVDPALKGDERYLA